MNSVVVGAVPVNNQIRICANLPVVEITASPITPGLVKTSYRNGEQVIMADLPVIEVVSDFPENNLITLAPQVNMPVVTLPEITVSAAPKGLLAVAVETPSGTINPLVNLPEVTISHGGGSGTGGFPYYYSGSSRWAYFIAEHGSRLIERILRSIIF
jgi:hypothetical protein